MFQMRRFLTSYSPTARLLSSSGLARSARRTGRHGKQAHFEMLEDRRLLSSTIEFDPAVALGTASNALGVAVGDLNSDNAADIVAALDNNTVEVLLNDGAGAFTSDASYATGTLPGAMMLKDLDGDGNLDLVSANFGSFDVSVLLGNGDGTFAAATTYAVSPTPVDLAIADVDGQDGVDIITANSLGNTVSILLNNGDGTFATVSNITISGTVSGLTVADFDGQNGPDLAVTDTSLDVVKVLLNNGDGTFAAAVSYATGSDPQTAVAADLDLDGDLDIATGNTGFGDTDTLSVLLNNGDGTFANAANSDVAAGVSRILAADLNMDNIPDLAGVATNGDLFLLGNNGDATFADPVTLSPVAGDPDRLAAGDIDNDGDVDIVTPDGAAHGLSLFHNITTPPPTAPGAPDLLPEFDTGVSDSDNITSINNDGADNTLQFTVTGVTVGSTVQLFAGNTVIGEIVADDTTVTITTDGNALADGTYGITAVYIDGGTESARSESTTLTIDTTTPTITSTAETTAPIGSTYSYDVESDEEGGVVYSLTESPAGMTIDSATGVITWDPVLSDFGDNDVTVAATDFAGNETTQQFTVTADGSLTFAAEARHMLSGNPFGITTGDFNGDGNTDAAVTFALGSVMIFTGNGDGTFTDGNFYNVGSSPRAVAANDVNGDGNLDLVTVNNGSDNISVLLGNGDGTFADAVNYAVGSSPQQLTMVDLDSTNGTDIVVTNSLGGNVSVLMNNGDGTFALAVNYTTGSGPSGVAAGDIDGDGDSDLVVANNGDASVTLLTNDGNGVMTNSGTVTVGVQPEAVALIDLNDDDFLDIATANSDVVNTLSLAFGNGDGTFADAQHTSLSVEPSTMIAADMNGDGPPDLVIADRQNNQVVILQNDSDGGFGDTVHTLDTGTFPDDLAAADINGDGMPDLMSPLTIDGELAIFLNETTAPPAQPTAPDLLPAFDTGSSATDNVTNLNNDADATMQFLINGVQAGATVDLFADGVLIGQAVAEGDSVTITTDGTTLLAEGEHAITTIQTFFLSSVESRVTTLTVDSVIPTIESEAIRFVAASDTYSYNVESDEEGSEGLTYSLDTAPAGMIIDPDTGEITWSPTSDQNGTFDVTARVTDLAGNTATQAFSVSVIVGNTDLIPMLGDQGIILTLPRSFSLVDPDSDLVQINYTGDGSLIMGSLNGNVEYLVAVGEVKNLTLKLKKGSGGDGRLNIGSFLAESINSFNGPDVYFTGGIEVVSNGGVDLTSISQFTFGGLNNNAALNITSGPASGVVIRAESFDTTGEFSITPVVKDMRVEGDSSTGTMNLNGGIKKLTVKGNWNTADGAIFGNTPSLLAADGDLPNITNAKFMGDVDGDFTITQPVVKKLDIRGDTKDLFTMTATGEMKNLRIRGEMKGTMNLSDAGKLRFDTIKGDVTAAVVNNFRTGDVEGNITVTSAKSFTAKGIFSGTFTGESARSFKVQGDLTGDVTFTLVAATVKDLASRKFNVRGMTTGATLRSSAGIRTMTFGNMVTGSAFLIGVDPAFDPAGGLPVAGTDDVLATGTTARVNRVNIARRAKTDLEEWDLQSSIFIAHEFGSMNLGKVFLANHGTLVGVAALSIDRIQLSSNNQSGTWRKEHTFDIGGDNWIDFQVNKLILGTGGEA